MTRPEVFLFGDSHAMALAHGLEAHGIAFAYLLAPNPWWQAGLVQPDEVTGVSLLAPALPERVALAQEALGVTDLTDPGIPVIGSFALTTGMLTAGIWDFPPEDALVNAVPGDLSDAIRSRRFSSGFVRDVVTDKFAAKYAILRKFCSNTQVVIVSQPRLENWQRRYVLEKQVIRDVLGIGAAVFDPSLMLGTQGTYVMPQNYLQPDGYHGNNAYGIAVIAAMIASGVLKAGAPPETEEAIEGARA